MKKDYNRMRSGRESLITIFYRPLVESIAKVLFKTSITANQMTTIGILLSIVAGCFFALGEWKYLVVGAVLTQLVLMSDMLDGKIARYKNLKSVFGEWYDGIANKIFKYFLFLGAAIGVYRSSGDPLILIIGAIAIFNVTMIAFILYIKHFFDFSKGHTELPRIKGFEIPFGLLTLVGLSIFALFNMMSLFLWIFATLGTLAWIKQIYSCYKLGKKYKVKT
jgi:phosphatidylglycerophosphate synthase